MLMLKYLLMTGGLGMIVAAVSILTYDLYRGVAYRPALATAGTMPSPPAPQLRWRGMAGVRVSQMSGTLPGTLYPGVHLVVPLVEDVASFDTRDQIFTTGISEDGKAAATNAAKAQLLDVQAKEGLTVGLAITVRYRLDPKRLDYIQSNLPHPVEREIVPRSRRNWRWTESW